MKKIFIIALILIQHSFVQAANYDRVIVTQYLEEQSYSALLDFVKNIPNEEQDNYLLNAAGYAAFQSALYEQSVVYYYGSFQKDSSNVQANLYLGIIKKQQKKFQEALHYYKRLLGIRPDQARFLKNVADCYAGIKNEDSQLVYLTKAYSLAPNDLNIAYSFAEALYAQKRYTEVDIVVFSSLAIDSNNSSLLSVGIRSAYFQKKYKDVLPLVTKIAALGLGEAVYTPVMFGVFAAIQLKDFEQSLVYSNYLMKTGVETEQVLYYASKAYAGLKRYEESNRLLMRCLQLAISENTEAYYIEMAENYKHLKVYSKAQKNYDTARFMFGNNILLYRKALAYDEIKDTAKAKKAYRDFLKLARNEDSAIVNFAKQRLNIL